ncbi:MAG: hypothetical protein U1F98_10375 [Verrucomicrobiota bacterium]
MPDTSDTAITLTAGATTGATGTVSIIADDGRRPDDQYVQRDYRRGCRE